MAPKSDKSKSSTAAPAANSDISGDLEIGSVEHLAKTIQRLQELQKETVEQTNTLSAIVTQNRQATETNAETIKKVEGLARDNSTNLACTNARIDAISAQIKTMDQRLETSEKLLDLSRKISECKDSVSQRELNDAALHLSLNGIEMARHAKNLDLEKNQSDRKIVEDALKKSFGPVALDFILKRTPDDSGFLNMEKLNTLHYQKKYADRVDESCRNSLIFRFKNRFQLGNFEKAIRRRLFATRDARRGTLQEHLDLNVFLPGKNGQLLETLLNAQARVSVWSSDTLSGWRLVWRRRYKNSNDLMLYSEVRASKEWMGSGDMKSFFFNDSGEQIRGHWTFLRNFDSGDPKRSFFPNLQTRTTEETQNRKGKASSSQAATTEDQEERSRDKDKTSGKSTGARTRTTGRSKSPRAEIPVITENADSQNEDELEEEGGCWNNVGRGKNNKRGRGAGSGRGRGADAGAGAKRGKGREDPSQPSMKDFIPDPRARLAAGGWS